MNASIVISIDKEKCKGCQLCIFFCPSKNLVLSGDLNKKGIKYAKVKDASVCSGCGLCFLVCPECCIEVCTSDEDRGLKREDGKKKE